MLHKNNPMCLEQGSFVNPDWFAHFANMCNVSRYSAMTSRAIPSCRSTSGSVPVRRYPSGVSNTKTASPSLMCRRSSIFLGNVMPSEPSAEVSLKTPIRSPNLPSRKSPDFFRLNPDILLSSRFLLPVLAHPGFKTPARGGIASAEGQRGDFRIGNGDLLVGIFGKKPHGGIRQ